MRSIGIVAFGIVVVSLLLLYRASTVESRGGTDNIGASVRSIYLDAVSREDSMNDERLDALPDEASYVEDTDEPAAENSIADQETLIWHPAP